MRIPKKKCCLQMSGFFTIFAKKEFVMKRFLTLMMLLTAVTLCSQAVDIAENQARQAAQAFFSSPARRAAGAVQPAIRLAYAPENREFYVFNRGAHDGFVLIGGDDRLPAVLGYADDGTFDYEALPENARYLLQCYEQEIAYLRTHPTAELRQPLRLATSVAPMLACQWGQRSPFNLQCPTFDLGGTVARSVTGCVATSMSQLMYYHRWPERGTGSHSYSFSKDVIYNGNTYSFTKTLSADFSQSVYEWDKMLDIYNSSSPETAQNAVAKLMSDVGISVEMSYGPSSSSAQSNDVVNALKTYFSYNEKLYRLLRDFYDLEDWEQRLRSELDAGRPLQYSGHTATAGHAFVLDGYDTDGHFHVNWGWTGTSDGYFFISLLNPKEQGTGSSEGGYNAGQGAIFGIQPNTVTGIADYWTFFCEALQPQEDSVALGQNATLRLYHFGLMGNACPTTIKYGIFVYDRNGNVAQQRLSTTTGLKAGLRYNGNRTFTPNASLAAGNYRLKVMYSLNGDNVYNGTALMLPGMTCLLYMRVANGYAYFINPAEVTGLVADVNGDGRVTIADANAVISILLNGENGQDAAILFRADVNGDGRITIADANLVIYYLLGI